MLEVVLYLKRSLSDAIFRDALLVRPVAAHHYIALLKEQANHDELTHTLLYIPDRAMPTGLQRPRTE